MKYIEWQERMDVDDYRGEVGTILRDMARPREANKVGRKSDEWIIENFEGASPDEAVGFIIDKKVRL